MVSLVKDLSFLDSRVLTQLTRFNLTNNVLSRSTGVVSCGGFSDVFKGTCHINKRGNVTTAMKRLRMYLSASDCKKVVLRSLNPNFRSLMRLNDSFSRRKSTFGQSFSTLTSCLCLGLHSMAIPAIPCSSQNGWRTATLLHMYAQSIRLPTSFSGW